MWVNGLKQGSMMTWRSPACFLAIGLEPANAFLGGQARPSFMQGFQGHAPAGSTA